MEITCVWSCFLASTAASPILRALQVAVEVGHATRLVGEAVVKRGLIPNLVSQEAKHLREDHEIHGDWKGTREVGVHSRGEEAAVEVRERMGEGQVDNH